MKEIMMYVLGVVVCSALFVLFYRIVLQGRTSFRTARMFLLGSLVAAIVIPAFNIPVWRSAPIELQPLEIQIPVIETAAAPVTLQPQTDWLQILLWTLYGVGIAALGALMVYQAVKIARMRRRAEIYSIGGCRIAVSEEVSAPFSFLATVYAPKESSPDEMRQIMLHESSHIRHHHSVEKIAMETLKSLLWFNPFAWWAARLLNEVHEFEADRDVLRGGCTVEEYLPVIFRQIFGYIPEISVGLGDSLTKKRFLMMKNQMKHTKYSWLRAAGVLPIATGMMMLFGFTHRAPEIVMTGDSPDMAKLMELRAEFAASHTESEESGERITELRAQVAQQKPDEPVFIAEVMPKFQNGDLNAFRRWVMERVSYPKEAHANNISGKVVSKFVIEADGSVSNVEIVSSPHQLLSDEISRIIKLSPKWEPGKHEGEAVRMYYMIPIDFILQGDDDKPIEPMKSVDVSALPTSASFVDDVVVVGYATQRKSSSFVDDVVVVGYGTQRKASVDTADNTTVDRIKVTSGGDPVIWIKNENREITKAEFSKLDANRIKEVAVLKGGSAVAAYGEDAKNGVIIVTLWNEGEERTTESVTVSGEKLAGDIKDVAQELREPGVTKITYVSSDDAAVTGSSGSGVVIISDTSKDPFIWLENEERALTPEELKKLDPNTIENISVLKGDSADKIPDDKMKAAMAGKSHNGVILISTKK